MATCSTGEHENPAQAGLPPEQEFYLPVRYAVLWFPVSSKLYAKEFGELEFGLLHGNLCHVHIYKALYGPHTHTQYIYTLNVTV